MDISRIKGLGLGKQLIIKKPGASALDFHSIAKVEGISYDYNCIYVRIEHGESIGTPMTGVPGRGAFCITHRDLDNFEAECVIQGEINATNH